MKAILDEVLRSQIHLAAGLYALWLVIGIAAGALAGIVAAVVLVKSRALRWDWKYAIWLRALSCLFVVAAGAFFGGSIGGCEGTLRGTEKVVRESRFRTEGLRRAGEAVAGAIVWIDFAVENHLTKKEIKLAEEQIAAVDLFLKGGREFDVRAFAGRLERTEEELVRKIVDSARADVAKQMNLAPGGTPDAILGMTLDLLADHGLKKSLLGQLEKHGVKEGVDGLFVGMDAAARAKGDPATAALPEMADGIVERSLIPLLLAPARALARGPQATSLVLMLASFLLPVLVFWLARKIEISNVPAPKGAPA